MVIEARREARTDYKPQPKGQQWLNAAMAHIRSVDYKVSARWVCYRLLQDGIIPSKKDFASLDTYMSKARKANWNGWDPFTLADSIRSPINETYPGTGNPDSKDPLDIAQDRLDEIEDFFVHVSRWWYEQYYVEVWYEARAMTEQFKAYVPRDVTLQAGGGDVSIPIKAAGARRLREWSQFIDKPPVILYFGDLDPKGEMIPQSAATELLTWCPGLTIHRIGLLPEHVERFALEDNPDSPGKYQWEAMTDAQAAELIRDGLAEFITDEAAQSANDRAEEIENAAMGHLRELLIRKYGE